MYDYIQDRQSFTHIFIKSIFDASFKLGWVCKSLELPRNRAKQGLEIKFF